VPDPLAPYDPIFQAASQEWNVDPLLLRSVAMQESGGKPNAVSKAGAQGLMQITPDTQKYLGVTDPNDPVQSIFGAAKYLSEGLDKEGSPEGALLYYHGGPGWRQAYGPESQAYVPAVAARYKAMAQAQPSASPPAAQTPPQPAVVAQGDGGQAPQPTAPPVPPPAAPQDAHPLIIGDSLASSGGLGGSGVVGAQPKAVLDNINALDPAQVRGRDVVLSSGASNNPAQASLVYDQVKALKAKGANNVTVVGVGDRPDIAGANDTLALVTPRAGGRFVALPADSVGPDHVHPTRAGYNALLASVLPKQMASR
jgi:Transglycosylase SLT domain